jgi:hypothetical protein
MYNLTILLSNVPLTLSITSADSDPGADLMTLILNG